MVIALSEISHQTWLIILAYFPLGIVGFWRWGVWLVKKGYAATYRPEEGVGTGTVAVITPVYNEDPAIFTQALTSWRENGVEEIVGIIDYTDTKCISIFKEFSRTFPGATLVITKTPGKRPALVEGIRIATTEFVALVDSDTIWEKHVKDYALVPFKNPKIGGVATRQSVLKPVTLAQRLFNAQLNLRYVEEVPFMVAKGGVVITCISGRTAFYRREAVLPLLDQLLNETFWGKPVISGDDKRLTYLIEAAGWHTAFQQNAQVYTPGAAHMKSFLKQRLRWTRNSWRADLRTLTQPWVWRHPRFTFYLLDRALQPFSQLLSPIFFLVSLALELWIPALILFVWWHVGRTLRMFPYLRKAPREVRLVPVFVLFSFYSSVMKIYALITLNRQGWITRWDAQRLPGPPPWLRLASAYMATGIILLALTIGVVSHEQWVLAAVQGENFPSSSGILSLAHAPRRTVMEPAFTGGQAIERYVVQQGDTLMRLAQRWQLASVDEIIRVNAARLPSRDYFETGLILDRPSPHHQIEKADFTSEYQELGPLRVTYVEDTNTIEVRGRGQQITLRTIAEEVDEQYLSEVNPREWYLGAHLAIKAGVTLRLQPTEVIWLKMRSDAQERVVLTVESGQLVVRGVKITSWDNEAADVDTRYDDGRSYIVAKGNSRFDIEESELAYLGEPPQPQGPVGVSGVSWHLSDAERGESIITGQVHRSRFHHNYDGLYISGGVGLRLEENQVYENVRYGIDLYDATHDVVVAHNEIYRNGTHGIILAQSSTANDIRANRVHDNVFHGIIVYQASHRNRLTENEVYHHKDGIVLHRSQDTVVTLNTVYENERGIRLTESTHSLISHNEVRNNVKHGVYLGEQSADTIVRDNTITRNPVGVYALSWDNTIAQNILRENSRGIALHQPAAGNRVQGNVLDHNRSGLYVKTTATNYVGENIATPNKVNAVLKALITLNPFS